MKAVSQETGEQGLVETLLQRIHQVANKVTKQRSACPERPQQQDLISHEEEEEDFHVGVLRQSKKLKVLPGQSKPIPHGPSILHTLLDAAETALELLPIESMFSQAASPYKDRDGKPWNNGVNSFAPTVRREGVPPGVTGVKYGIWGMMNAAFKPGDAQERCENCRLMGHNAGDCPKALRLAPAVNGDHGNNGWFRKSPYGNQWVKKQNARWDEQRKRVVWD